MRDRKNDHTHRDVAERTLGRKLQPTEVVDHRNEDKTDQTPTNLAVKSRSVHTSEHNRTRSLSKLRASLRMVREGKRLYAFAAAVVLVAALSACRAAPAAPGPATATFIGTVTDMETQQPISGARVQILGGSYPHTFTNSFGVYGFQAIPLGRTLIEFSATGYLVRELDLDVEGPVGLDVALAADPRD